MELTKTSEQDELQYTTDLLNGDKNDVSFSNYSAWHNRRYAYLKKWRHLWTRMMVREIYNLLINYIKFTIFCLVDITTRIYGILAELRFCYTIAS